jgi:hypothetical protein
MRCPILCRSMVITDDAQLAARMSCALAAPGQYVPILEGPRMTRDDREAEAIRLNNALGRGKAETVFLAGLPVETSAFLAANFAPRLRPMLRQIQSGKEIDHMHGSRQNEPLQWGREHIGLGLLKALRARSDIHFNDSPSPRDPVASKAPHLVVCEEGNDIAQVIAANYAYALGAGLCLIPEVNETLCDELLEQFYAVYDNNRDAPLTDLLGQLKAELLALCGPLPIPVGGSITFVTSGLPFGFGVSNVPSTHMFSYPNMGVLALNGFAAEQPKEPGMSFVCLVDPNKEAEAREIRAAERLLAPRGAFVRTYCNEGANVRDVAEMLEWLPYDLVVISTHCGDPDGYRWTYEYEDSEGRSRRLVVDIALSVGSTDEPNMVGVTLFQRFVSLDGVDWLDRKAKAKLYVGTAMNDFIRLTRDKNNELKPVLKEEIDRVLGAAALKMSDHNLIILPKPLANGGTPIVINNACVSWHRLAKTFSFCNARAYIGTLFPVTEAEAEEVVIKLLERHHEKPIAHALWASQREVYGSDLRRPYVVTGIYPQTLRVKRHEMGRTIRRLESSLRAHKAQLAQTARENREWRRAIAKAVAFYETQVAHFHALTTGKAPPGLVKRGYTRRDFRG